MARRPLIPFIALALASVPFTPAAEPPAPARDRSPSTVLASADARLGARE
jgi:hypothetical protein